MNKKTLLAGVAIAAVLMVIFSAVILSDDMDAYDDKEPNGVPFTSDGDELDETSLPYVLFEDYGPVLLVLAVLMFGAIIGGAYIAKEDDEDDTD
ncbi:MAG: hypothetical protein FWH44_01260 [Methanomassiliicoccaceae archaeon]|nr:hypothetical protein [Methanomassiliicoccaceae archaeon]